mmetsp:Transcript_28059/g.36771  ORF Transcript_28059/g.36771 Transcript_28059/m.36771 type:complete len:91 (+) Transcript_28059:264-536(+)
MKGTLSKEMISNIQRDGILKNLKGHKVDRIGPNHWQQQFQAKTRFQQPQPIIRKTPFQQYIFREAVLLNRVDGHSREDITSLSQAKSQVI